jgi:hypothetical protein
LTSLAAFTLLPLAALADEPPPSMGAPRAERVVVDRHVARAYEVRPGLVPDCSERYGTTLLKCAPRVYVPPRDVATLNQLNAIPTRVVRPYPYLFSW